ncbi:recombinase family protein [Streptococcus sinensis]|uniref:recombinase family protein n=1 Tax=Streptococcus sinensis TaxID=176090 RepID=UPI002729EC6F|nr:recombinase family protein [Streptococcus sinensis]
MTKYHINKFKDLQEIKIGYARVSSTDNRQELGLEVQKEALKSCDILFIEKESGSQDNRVQLLKALKLAKELKQINKQASLVVYKLDRLTRKMFTLVNILDDLTIHDIQLISLKENIATDSLTGKLLVVILGYVAEMELEAIRSRTKDGLRKAKERGVKLGNKGISKTKEKEVIQLYQQSNLTAKEISQTSNISTATLYNILKRNNIKTKSKNTL